MLVKIEARILIFPGTDFRFPSTFVPPGTFLGYVGTTVHWWPFHEYYMHEVTHTSASAARRNGRVRLMFFLRTYSSQDADKNF